MCPRARNMLEIAMPQEAPVTIIAAYNVFKHSSPAEQDPFISEEFQVPELRYGHALLRLKDAYPGTFCGFSEQSYMEILGWTVHLYLMGHRVPAAVKSAGCIGFPLEQMACEFPADA